jgi:hypothetical protein
MTDYPPMPPHVRAKVQRTMDWVAERLLDLELDQEVAATPDDKGSQCHPKD